MDELDFKILMQRTIDDLRFYDWDIKYSFEEWVEYVWWLKYVDYKRFQAYIIFNKNLLNECDSYIKEVIVHELCHIFTISSLMIFKEDELVKNMMWQSLQSELTTRMDIINEQMNVRLHKLILSLINK